MKEDQITVTDSIVMDTGSGEAGSRLDKCPPSGHMIRLVQTLQTQILFPERLEE